jgi:hypothetical protein
VRNVNLPLPVLAFGAVLCLLGGYLLGVVLGPEGPDRSVGTVESYDPRGQRLCLSGDAVEDHESAQDGVLCGTWQKAQGSRRPGVGDTFRFVASVKPGRAGDDDRVVIFGEVD